MATDVQLKKLTGFERIALKDCETKIERGLKTFYEVGASLLEIRNQKLYRGTHETFEDYCEERWGFSKRHCNRLIAAAKVAENLGPIGPVPNESQAREIARLPDDQQSGAWTDTIERCGGVENVTAAEVKKTVDLWSADNEPYAEPEAEEQETEDEEKPEDEEPSVDGELELFNIAVALARLENAVIAELEGWPEESLCEAANRLEWLAKDIRNGK